MFVLCVSFLIWDVVWVCSFLFGFLIYALASTNNNNKKKSSQYWFFPSDNMIKKNQNTHKLNTITKTQNQNIQKWVRKLRIKKKLKTYIREPKTLMGIFLFFFSSFFVFLFFFFGASLY